ncbi:MAG: antitoxin VapB family protein [archaeon]
MTTKTITIMEDAYELLRRAKLPNESFSDTIRREVRPKKNILSFCGALSKEEGTDLKTAIEENRKLNRRRDIWKKSMFA